MTIVGILPHHYVHILDLNTNVTSLVVGPQNFMLQDNHKLVCGPFPFITVPPHHYCTVLNPIKKSTPLQEGKPCDLKFGHKEIRFFGEPFPLYPGESLDNASPDKYHLAMKKLPCIKANFGLHLRALVTIEEDEAGTARKGGDEWQLIGPITYLPQPEVEIVRLIAPEIIAPNCALRLRAQQDLTDMKGAHYCSGEEWLVREVGAYLPGVFEEVVGRVKSYTVSAKEAVHIKSHYNYTDQFGVDRHIGDEWLVTEADTETYIPDVTEEIVCVVKVTVLKRHQYCILLNPVGADGRNCLGIRQLRVGPKAFFLQPGEYLEAGIKNTILLQSDEAVVLTAVLEFDDVLPDGTAVHRDPGDKWMMVGPAEFTPRIELGKIEKRKSIPLNKNEGIYVQDTKTGKVRSILGPQAYMLLANEELHAKQLEPLVDEILKNGGGIGDSSIRKMSYFEGSIDPEYQKRDKTKVVTYRCPCNTAVQVYNYQQKTARVVFGPDLVVLDPHESFNILFLSAGKPKVAGTLITICLMLGPDFISDTIVVETSDHARLKVAIAMNNIFKYDKGDPASVSKLFAIPDFIGFACREVASRIRGAVASVPFEVFHKYSASIIHAGVFGKDKDGNLKIPLTFSANNLVITNIDVKSIEPVDHHMRDSLMKSVQMAIEISTNSIECSAEQEAKRMEQKAYGKLERQKLQSEKESEEARMILLELQAVAAAVESSGQSKAEAQAQAEKLLIEGKSAIEIAELKANAAQIESETQLECLVQAKDAEIAYLREQNELEVAKAKALSIIEIDKFSGMVDSLGTKTITAIAVAGPKAKVHVLQSLGIQSALFTDGHSPVNLFQTAKGLAPVI